MGVSGFGCGGSLRAVAATTALVLMLGGCLPIPNLQSDLEVAPPKYRVQLSEIDPDFVEIRGHDEPNTPDEHDRTAYLSYSLDAEPEVVVVMLPGLFGGAASMDSIARQLVAATPGLEVWAVDRRSNLLEDRTGFRRALAAGDPWLAHEYYLERRGQDGGFRPAGAADLDFLRYWGLEVHLEDLHRVVLAARDRAPSVVLAGHSLGAAMVSLYAAWEIRGGRDPSYGQDFIAGLVLLDGALGRTGAFDWDDVGLGLGPLRFAPSIQDLERGRGGVYSESFVTPDYQLERDLIALFAQFLPNEDAPATLTDLPISNEALAGVRNDDHYAFVPIFSVSMGEAIGADYAGNLTAVILGGAEGVRSRTVTGAAAGHERVEWGPGNPLREHTDLGTYLRAWTLPETNFTEWYFPLRLVLDISLLEPSLAEEAGYLPNSLITVPTLLLGAGRGLMSDLSFMRGYVNLRYGSPITAYVLSGLTHIDIVAARSNPVVPILQRWIAFFTSVA